MKPTASLVWVKSKWYVQVTVPSELRAALKGQKQIRRSTGTSDRRIAEKLKHDIAQEIYSQIPDPDGWNISFKRFAKTNGAFEISDYEAVEVQVVRQNVSPK